MCDPRVRAAARRELWKRGRCRHILRPDGQQKLHSFIDSLPTSTAPIFLKCHRRLGKSFLGIAVADARCRAEPGHIAKVAAPTKEQCNQIVRPNLRVVHQSCPLDLRPKEVRGVFEYHNPYWKFMRPDDPKWTDPDAISTLEIHGANWKRGDGMRGLACDTWVFDEVRDFDYLDYLIKDVVSYQFAGRKNPLTLMLSTPPRNIDHESITVYQKAARAAGRYMCVKSFENSDWTEADERAVLDIVGSKDTIGWRREAECEDIADPDDLILPEFHDGLIEERKLPAHFNVYTVMDTGWADFTAVGFWALDFEAQVLYLVDELFVHNTTTGDLARAVKEKEQALWGAHIFAGGGKLRRFADATQQQINDLRSDHKLRISPVEKHDREGQTIASFRTSMQSGKIRVHPRCEEHIYQFSYGVWNEKRTDFIRSTRLGHCDCIAEAAYANRMVNWRRNPFPPAGYSKQHQFKPPRREKRNGTPLSSALGRN